MHIIKQIQTTVHIQDAGILYSGDIDAVIMDNLVQRFVGKCFMSCLVQKILRIINKGSFTICRQRQDGSASCSVHFEVDGIIAERMEILHNCVVQKVDSSGNIICKNEHTAIFIKHSDVLKNIKEGQVIVTRVGAAKYHISKPAISINGYPFVPYISPTVYFSIVAKKSNIVKNALTVLDAEYKTNSTLDAKCRKYFSDLLYPYKKASVISGAKLVSIDKILEEKGTITISHPDSIPQDKLSIYIHDKVPATGILESDELKAAPDGLIITESSDAVLGQIIYRCIKHERTVRQLCTIYNTMDLVKQNSNLWAIYSRYKR